tara:strand:- start:927 stop:2792 length:1866 start_codon:yes stop_codon:yes gene_type:complete
MALVSLESNLRAMFEANFAGATLDNRPALDETPVLTYGSRLYNLHLQGRQTEPFITDFGRIISPSRFTRPFLPLADYHAQGLVDDGIFGFRNDGLTGDNQPYVIRGIGQRWGVENVQIPDTIPLKSKLSLALSNQFGAVSNREPSVFKDRFRADVLRLSKFADPNSLYTKNQEKLQKRNAFDSVTSIKFGSTKVDSGNKWLDPILSATPLGTYFSLHPQVYNPDSVYSVPGVSGMMINRMGMTAFEWAADTEDVIGIAENISQRALELAAPVAAKKVTESIGKALKDKFGTTKGSEILLDHMKIGKIDGANQKTKTLRESLNTKFGKKDQSLIERSDGIIKTVKAGNALRKEAGLLFAHEKAAAGKIKLRNLDPAAFEDLDVDRVNLIPYGKKEYKDKSYDQLDWIPFKFYDEVAKKHIVFRALLSGITDTFSPEYASERYIGRPDSVHVYQGTNREISFTFDVYPKSDSELPVLWTKLDKLSGLTYPHWTPPDASGGRGMISPYTKLTIGDMYKEAPGYISSLTYTVQDNGTWEVDFAKLPKYIQVACTFIYIGNRRLEAGENTKNYDVPFIPETIYETKAAAFVDNVANALVEGVFSKEKTFGDEMKKAYPDILGATGK